MEVEPEAGRTSRRWLRLTLLLLPAAAFLGLLTYATLARSDAPQPGDAAPPFHGPLLSGEGTLGLDQLRGRPVVLNFWASWCVPQCTDEAPILRDAHELYEDQVAFVGVNIKDSISSARRFVDRFGITYPNIRDVDLEIYDDYGLTGQPETFFIDADGAVIEHHLGPLDRPTLLRLVDVLVARGA